MADEERRQFVKYDFYKVDPLVVYATEDQRSRDKYEFASVVEESSSRLFARSYSLVGLRGDADFLLWQVAESLENLQEQATTLWATSLGRYLTQPYSYLSMTNRSQYVGKHQHSGQEGVRVKVVSGGVQYLIVYPFLKTREWYLLPQEERQRMMNDHFTIGHKYPSVKINTTYSFGLDDQEFVVAFETDKPSDFLDLVMDLRGVQSSLYTLKDIPVFTCIHLPIDQVLDTLGG